MILGIDEVGRGPWAGPLVVGAVILGPAWKNNGSRQDGECADMRTDELASAKSRSDKNQREVTNDSGVNLYQCWLELRDSKKLSVKKREFLYDIIRNHALATGLGWVSSAEVDQYGLGNSLKLAARRAVKQVLSQKIIFDEIIIDGTNNLLQDTPLSDRVTTLKKGDDLIKEISAASIIAKVARDRYMQDLAIHYPNYAFEKHVGYGTAAHKEAIEKFGLTPEHRTSFRPIRQYLERNNKYGATIIKPQSRQKTAKRAKTLSNTTEVGKHAEQVVINYLLSKRHEILAKNYRTATYEIDIISKTTDEVFFTEVKYRKDVRQGQAIMQITPQKLQQMTFAAENFLAQNPDLASLEPHLAAGAVEGVNYDFREWLVLD